MKKHDSTALVNDMMLEILTDATQWAKLPPQETAILILPGKFQEYRVKRGVKLFPKRGRYLWIAGTRGDTKYNQHIILEALLDGNDHNVFFGPNESDTRSQMLWALGMLEGTPMVKHIIMATAAYHLPRCLLTFLAAAKKKVMVSPWPLMDPTGTADKDLGSFRSEREKIQEYQEKGHVLLSEDWKEYVRWRNAR